MSDLEKHWARLLIEVIRKHAPLPHMFPIAGIISAIVVATYLTNTKLLPPLETVLTDGHNLLAIVLFAVVLVLAIVYAFASYFELLWARENWKELIPTPDASNLLSPVFISGALTLMAFLTPDIKRFALAYLAYAMLDSMGCVLYLATINTSLKKAVQSTRQRYKTKEFCAVVTFYQRR